MEGEMRNIYFGPFVIDAADYDLEGLRMLLEEAEAAVSDIELWIEEEED